jgi:hypothetical protein
MSFWTAWKFETVFSASISVISNMYTFLLFMNTKENRNWNQLPHWTYTYDDPKSKLLQTSCWCRTYGRTTRVHK